MDWSQFKVDHRMTRLPTKPKEKPEAKPPAAPPKFSPEVIEIEKIASRIRKAIAAKKTASA